MARQLVSSDLLADGADGCEEFYQREGYLLLRQVFPREVVDSMRNQIIRGIGAMGGLQVGATPDSFVLRDGTIDITLLHQYVDYSEIWKNSEVTALMDRIFQEPVFVWRSVILRVVAPGRSKNRAVPHQDGYYTDHTATRFRTVWIPLQEPDQDVGGIAIVPESHRSGIREVVVSTESFQANAQAAPFRTIPQEAIEGDWIRAVDLHPGDLLMFHPCLIHQGCPNFSEQNRLRLSIDFRVQPLSDVRPPQSAYMVPDFSKYLKVDENGRLSY
jgi:hypothetical protein